MYKAIKCPKCEGYNIVSCKGSTNYKPVKGIKYICSDCLYEFGNKK